MRRPAGSEQAAEELVRRLAEMFRRKRWRVRRGPRAGGRAQLVAEGAGRRFAVEVIRSPEGRRDRLIPLLSQAILQARKAAEQMEGAVPLAVVASNRIPPGTAERVKQFALDHAPDVGVGIVDALGLRSFAGHGLEAFNAAPVRQALSVPQQRLPDLFSDLNQWMLKILLGQRLPEALIAAPRGPFRSATQLAGAAGVSVMSAARFLHALRREGFLDEGSEEFRIVRWADLLERWAAAVEGKATDVAVRWIVRRDLPWLLAAIRDSAERFRGRVQIALGLAAAAEMLQFGFVNGVGPHLYVDRFDPEALAELGLTPTPAEGRADAFVRVAAWPEAVFRAAVPRDGVMVSDIVQVWVDVARLGARGREQADLIWRRVFVPSLGGR